MSKTSIIDLYTDLAVNPEKDFGWDKGFKNALNHKYKKEWIEHIPDEVWKYCAAVGNPFLIDTIQKGESVLDLGCGAGVDLCVASLLVGETGKVFGIDVTPAMVEKSMHHASLANLLNITVYEGSFDNLPINNNSIDVVISNGAINLVPSKEKVFSEVYRVLKTGGRFTFSDMIKIETTKEDCCCNSESWADCVAGTLESDTILQMLAEAGFSQVELIGTNHYKTSESTVGATFSARKA